VDRRGALSPLAPEDGFRFDGQVSFATPYLGGQDTFVKVSAAGSKYWSIGPQLVLRGAKERLAPILMTALATGLALVPLAVAGSIPGHEIEHPMAIVILGGLVTATLLNLFVLPSLYLRFGRGRDRPPTAPILHASPEGA